MVASPFERTILEWGFWMKSLEIARLQDFAPNTQVLLGDLSGPQTPCRIERTPLWKFLSTGLLYMTAEKNLNFVFHFGNKIKYIYDILSQLGTK